MTPTESLNGAAGGTLATGGGAFKTLEQFIIERESDAPGSKGQFSRLLRDIVVAAKIVDRDVRKAGLVDLFGDTGDVNVQDEIQKKLDLLAHQAALQFTAFTGLPAPVQQMRDAGHAALDRR